MQPQRSHLLLPDGPVRGGVVMLHGLTDAPYSLRSIGQALVARGYYVVGLRLPGQGVPRMLCCVGLRCMCPC